jgi:hypothetical protein
MMNGTGTLTKIVLGAVICGFAEAVVLEKIESIPLSLSVAFTLVTGVCYLGKGGYLLFPLLSSTIFLAVAVWVFGHAWLIGLPFLAALLFLASLAGGGFASLLNKNR